jgi:uncharacterized metal-binding protein
MRGRLRPQPIFPCSGGSDVGAITDQAARKLSTLGLAKGQSPVSPENRTKVTQHAAKLLDR